MAVMIIRWDRAHVTKLAGMRIAPGTNRVSENLAPVMVRNKVFLEQEKRGVIRVLEGDPRKKGSDKEAKASKSSSDSDLAEMKANEAIDIVHDTFDLAILAEWKKAEERKTVLFAIEDQIDKINEKGKYAPPESKKEPDPAKAYS